MSSDICVSTYVVDIPRNEDLRTQAEHAMATAAFCGQSFRIRLARLKEATEPNPQSQFQISPGLTSSLACPARRHWDLIMGLLAARICHPTSKLATLNWFADTALGVDHSSVSTDELYAAMDWLLAQQPHIEKPRPHPAGPQTVLTL